MVCMRIEIQVCKKRVPYLLSKEENSYEFEVDWSNIMGVRKNASKQVLVVRD